MKNLLDKGTIELAQWLKDNGLDVFLNETNPHFPTFSVHNTKRQKPDMLVRLWDTFIVAELKNPDAGTSTIAKSQKILRYYKHFLDDARYIINNTLINDQIKHFAVATANSPQGKIFSRDHHIPDSDMSKTNLYVRKTYPHILPRREYRRTHDFLRHLWQGWNEMGRTPPYSIGALVSDALNHHSPTKAPNPKPALFTMIHTPWGWKQRFFILTPDDIKRGDSFCLK